MTAAGSWLGGRKDFEFYFKVGPKSRMDSDGWGALATTPAGCNGLRGKCAASAVGR